LLDDLGCRYRMPREHGPEAKPGRSEGRPRSARHCRSEHPISREQGGVCSRRGKAHPCDWLDHRILLDNYYPPGDFERQINAFSNTTIKLATMS